MTETSTALPAGESSRTVLVAFVANLCVALAKTVAAVISGSASMVAESAHSWADTGNQIFLLIANRRGARPADARHPMGHGREVYVWSLLAAVGLFVVGAAVSIWHGISDLLHEPRGHENYLIAYIVLGIALLFEGASFLQATRQLHDEAQTYDRDLLEHALATSDPTTRAVFLESMSNPTLEVLVGVLLAVVAVILIDRNRRFLTGEPASSKIYAVAEQRLADMRDVEKVRFLRLEFIGPKQLFLVGSVDLVGDDTESNVARRLRSLERELEKDPLALKIDSVEINARDNNGQQLSLGLQVSGLRLNPQP